MQKPLIVANDLGYGNLKMTIDEERIFQPTVISPIDQDYDDTIDHTDSEAVKNTVDDLLNQMNVEIDGAHYLVGNAAQNSTIERISTDINARSGKAHTEAAKLVPLSTIAAQVVKKAYDEGEDIFSPLSATVIMAASLPIEDIENNPDDREYYQNIFVKNNHIVVFRNFDYKISVTIRFKSVQVYKEGEVALAVAIKYANNQLKKYFEDYISKQKLTMATDDLGVNGTILGIDIGFETTEFALLVNGRADAFNSNSISKGYGNVLASAWRYLPKIAQGYTVKDVVAFKKLLNSNPTTKIQKENQEFALKAEQTAMPALNRSIISNLNAILGTTDDLRTIYLYGGGSIPLVEKADLIDQINASLQNYRSDAPVIWLGEKFSSIANLMGLEILAKALAKTLNKS